MILTRAIRPNCTRDGMIVYRYAGPTMIQFERGKTIGDARMEFYVGL